MIGAQCAENAGLVTNATGQFVKGRFEFVQATIHLRRICTNFSDLTFRLSLEAVERAPKFFRLVLHRPKLLGDFGIKRGDSADERLVIVPQLGDLAVMIRLGLTYELFGNPQFRLENLYPLRYRHSTAFAHRPGNLFDSHNGSGDS